MARVVPTAEEAASARRYRDLLILAAPATLARIDRLLGDYLAILDRRARHQVERAAARAARRANGVRVHPSSTEGRP